MAFESAADYFSKVDQLFVPEAAKGMKAVFQFELAGEGGGTYHIAVEDGTMSWKNEAHPAPGITIKMDAKDYVQMVNGKLNGQMAFMTGKMKVAGQIPLAMKMQTLFPIKKA